MPYPHDIGLRGPWTYEPLGLTELGPAGHSVAVAGELPPPGRVTMPCSWEASLGLGYRGRVRYTRAFTRPTNLDPRERVWLVLDGVDHFGAVTLNQQPLGEWAGYAWETDVDITERLADRNQLAVEVELPADPQHALCRPGRQALAGGLVGEVRLEVRRGLYLDRLGTSACCGAGSTGAGEGAPPGQTLEVSGRVAGDPDSLLSEDLVIVIQSQRREVLYEPVVPREEFRFRIPVEGLPTWQPGQPHRLDQAAIVEVSLMSDGFALWQRSIPVFCQAEAQLLSASEIAALPRPSFADGPPTPEGFRAALGSPVPRLIYCEQILSDAHYEAFTQMGLAAVQACPANWLPQVRPRLSRHACIVQWLE